MGQYKHHIFVCNMGKTCSREGGDQVYKELKQAVKDAGLKGSCRVNQAGCMNQCGHGPMVVVYPADVWYAGVTPRNARRIVIEHIMGGQPVGILRHRAPPGDNKK
ncbi:MAG: (2Fe-2S) ferredoxin domain-containing protein [Gemmatimonadaceae bacterium]|nr:(2Fe-2S) ferredoxin domain-containing protein [Gemmatimonadaceae bacterium]